MYYFISALVLFIIFWIKTRSSSGLKPEASQSLNFLWVLKLYINNLCLCIIPGKWKIIKASSKQQPPAIGSLHGPSLGPAPKNYWIIIFSSINCRWGFLPTKFSLGSQITSMLLTSVRKVLSKYSLRQDHWVAMAIFQSDLHIWTKILWNLGRHLQLQ